MKTGDIVRLARGRTVCTPTGREKVNGWADYKWRVINVFKDGFHGHTFLVLEDTCGTQGKLLATMPDTLPSNRAIWLENGKKIEISEESYQALAKEAK